MKKSFLTKTGFCCMSNRNNLMLMYIINWNVEFVWHYGVLITELVILRKMFHPDYYQRFSFWRIAWRLIVLKPNQSFDALNSFLLLFNILYSDPGMRSCWLGSFLSISFFFMNNNGWYHKKETSKNQHEYHQFDNTNMMQGKNGD